MRAEMASIANPALARVQAAAAGTQMLVVPSGWDSAKFLAVLCRG